MLRRLLAAALLAAAVSVFAGAPPASAHDRLVSSSPPEGARVAAPDRVDLVFSGVLLDRFGELAVTGPDGRRYDRGAPRVVDRTIGVDLLPLPVTGRYTAAYRIVSSDGHPVSGQVTFTVTKAVPGATTPPEPSPSAGAAGGTGSSGLLSAAAAAAAAVAALVAVTAVVRRRRRPPVGGGAS
jgi:methionine-rich copper-binding protein CopC